VICASAMTRKYVVPICKQFYWVNCILLSGVKKLMSSSPLQ
jgi:hypothetical protein